MIIIISWLVKCPNWSVIYHYLNDFHPNSQVSRNLFSGLWSCHSMAYSSCCRQRYAVRCRRRHPNLRNESWEHLVGIFNLRSAKAASTGRNLHKTWDFQCHNLRILWSDDIFRSAGCWRVADTFSWIAERSRSAARSAFLPGDNHLSSNHNRPKPWLMVRVS